MCGNNSAGNKTCSATQAQMCAQSADGCLKCTVLPAGSAVDGGAVLLAPQDHNADETLRLMFVAQSISFSRFGPLMIVPGGRDAMARLVGFFGEKLNEYTRSCIRGVYSPSMPQTAEMALKAMTFAEPLENFLANAEHEWVRDALAEQWLFSVFHPILEARTGKTFAQECLIRARDPRTGKILGAGQIIQACEALNLEHQLDQRARQAAISGGARHTASGEKLFINFLPNTIYDPAVCLRTTMQAAEDNGVEMSRLVFEVVETEKIPDMGKLLNILDYYRQRGVGTAVDDMGAGFTSVEYIHKLRPDFVKLDRELVISAETNTAARSNMKMIIDATHAAGGRIVAEGIETASQQRMCTDSGCDLLQGFRFCKPSCPPAQPNFTTANQSMAA